MSHLSQALFQESEVLDSITRSVRRGRVFVLDFMKFIVRIAPVAAYEIEFIRLLIWSCGVRAAGVIWLRGDTVEDRLRGI
jgi:hypothetical protein